MDLTRSLPLFIALLVSGCTTPLATGDGPDTPEPDFERDEVWAGTLTGVASNGTRAVLALDTTVQDCEAQTGAARLDVKVAAHLMPFQGDLTAFLARARDDPAPLTSTAALEPGARYLMAWREPDAATITDDVVDVVRVHSNGTAEARLAAHPAEPVLWIGEGPGSPPRVFEWASRPFSIEDLASGTAVVLHVRGDPLRLDAVRLGTDAGDDCGPRHRHDLRVLPHQAPATFPAGVPITLDVRIENVQDQALTLRASAADLVDLDVLRPYVASCPAGQDSVQQPGAPGGTGGSTACSNNSLEERMASSRVPGCTVAVHDISAPAESTVAWPLTVTCAEDRMQTSTLAVVANGSFTDELGVEHAVPQRTLDPVATFIAVNEARAG